MGRILPVANADIPATIFCVADLTPRLRQILGRLRRERDARQPRLLRLPPDAQGVYYEVIDYTKMLQDAKSGTRIFFDKLKSGR